MPNIAAKDLVVDDLKDKLERSQGVVLTDYRGLSVAAITKLRVQLREAGIEFKVVKNTMTRIAAGRMGLEGLNPYLEGPTAIAFGFNDPVSPAKIISDFAKTNKELSIKAGLVEGKVIDPQGVKALAELPPRDVLLAQVAGTFQSPLTAMANVLQGPLRKLVYALEEIRKQKSA